jgi:deoxyribodipyrimidine photolyase-related protein
MRWFGTMTETSLVLPTNLFEDGPPGNGKVVFVVEASRYFKDFDFHKKKILLHRASLKNYSEKLKSQGYNVKYFSSKLEDPLERSMEEVSTASSSPKLVYYDPVDKPLREKIEEFADEFGVELERKESPGFVTEVSWFQDNFGGKGYRMTKFYRKQRRRLDVLVDRGKPEGGKWSFDPENRKSLPESVEPPSLPDINRDRSLKDEKGYVNSYFQDNPGTLDNFIFPVNREESLKWLDDFLDKRFKSFGDYEDAISRQDNFIFHSLLSPLINIGLLKPMEVVDAAVEAYRNDPEIGLNSVEGFVRQIIGWREYVRLIYELESEKQKKSNFWEHQRSIPPAFYEARTGIPPIDRTIEKINKHGYIHHIERLMVIGNFMLLCGINPDDVYKWFMELSIDSYDWVMTPNVYGMSQYADGGLIMTKPYISSSNYIRKMSDYSSGDWCEVWDGLYWRFIKNHREKFEDIPRMAVMVSNLDRMSEETVSAHVKRAEEFLEEIF